MTTIAKVAVVGAGIMGRGIAQVAAESGFQVNVVDLDQSIVLQGIDEIATPENVVLIRLST